MQYWPSILAPQSISWIIKPMVSRGPSSFGGRRQIGAGDVGYWTCSMSSVPAGTPDQIREWRAMVAAMQGGAEDIIVGVYDQRQAPWPGAERVVRQITYSDGTTHSDGTTFQQSTIAIVLAEAAALRATSLKATVQQAGPLRRGMYFSMRDRLHIITSVPDVDGATVTFNFLPTLREAHTAGEPLQFGRPTCRVRMTDPTAGALSLERGTYGFGSLDFEESADGLL